MTKPQYPFAFDALPRPGQFGLPLLEAAVKEAVADRKVPLKMPYFTAAAAYCAVAQLTSDVYKPVGGKSGTGVYMLVMADSGERKTAIRNDFFSPLDKVTSELKTQFEKEKKEFDMSHHDGRCIQRQRALDHHTWIHLGSVHRPGEHALHGDEVVAAIEKGYLEVLPCLAAQPQPEE